MTDIHWGEYVDGTVEHVFDEGVKLDTETDGPPVEEGRGTTVMAAHMFCDLDLKPMVMYNHDDVMMLKNNRGPNPLAKCTHVFLSSYPVIQSSQDAFVQSSLVSSSPIVSSLVSSSPIVSSLVSSFIPSSQTVVSVSSTVQRVSRRKQNDGGHLHRHPSQCGRHLIQG
jgi:hypothetical protein